MKCWFAIIRKTKMAELGLDILTWNATSFYTV